MNITSENLIPYTPPDEPEIDQAGNEGAGKSDAARHISALVRHYQLTGNKDSLDLAQRLFFNHEVPGYNDQIKMLESKNKNIVSLTNTFNSKYGEKDEEDLSDTEKAEMEKILKQIETEQKAVETLQAEQKKALEKFQALIAQTKTRLGIS